MFQMLISDLADKKKLEKRGLPANICFFTKMPLLKDVEFLFSPDGVKDFGMKVEKQFNK
jgi:hypothetical protein